MLVTSTSVILVRERYDSEEKIQAVTSILLQQVNHVNPINKDYKHQQGSAVSNITNLDSDDEMWQPNKETLAQPLRPLTKKRKAFVKAYATSKQITKGEAALEAGYKAKSKAVASQIAHELLKKPEIQTELAKYESKAEHNLMVLADKTTEYAMAGGRDGAAYASVSEKVNNSIIDRLKGKATQRTEVTSKAVTLNIDLSGSMVDDKLSTEKTDTA